jgi:hypothetical protein
MHLVSWLTFILDLNLLIYVRNRFLLPLSTIVSYHNYVRSLSLDPSLLAVIRYRFSRTASSWEKNL